MLETLPIANWNGPYDAALKARAVAALEQGAVLFFPNLAFTLSDAEKPILDAGVSDGKAKNISLDHTTGKMQASSLTGEKAASLAAMIERFGSQATQLVHDFLPYRNVERARTSYRPVQVKGRHYSKINDDRLLHVDAFPSRPMRGRRILRFFANVAPSSSRKWHVGEPFEDFARVFLPKVGPHLPVMGQPPALMRHDALEPAHGCREGQIGDVEPGYPVPTGHAHRRAADAGGQKQRPQDGADGLLHGAVIERPRYRGVHDIRAQGHRRDPSARLLDDTHVREAFSACWRPISPRPVRARPVDGRRRTKIVGRNQIQGGLGPGSDRFIFDPKSAPW